MSQRAETACGVAAVAGCDYRRRRVRHIVVLAALYAIPHLTPRRPDWDAGGDPASADPPGASTFALGAWGHDAMANAAVLSDVHAGLLRVMDLPEDAISAMPPRVRAHAQSAHPAAEPATAR